MELRISMLRPTRVNSDLVQLARLIALGFATFFGLAWLAAFYPFTDPIDRFGAPLGGDFPMFYIAGQTVLAGQSEQLYNDGAQQRRLHELFPQLAPQYSLPFRYPPLVAWLMAPLAMLPYPVAYALFAITMFLLWWGAAWLLSRDLGETDTDLKTAAMWLMLACPIGWEAIIGGQASPLALAICAGAWYLLRRQHPVWAGAILALALYKPNVLALFALGCLLSKSRVWLGAVIMAVLLGLLSIAAVGAAGIVEYLQYGSRLALETWQQETPIWKVQGLGAWVSIIAPGRERFILLVVGLAMAAVISWKWRGHGELHAAARAAAALLVLNFLCNPYVPIYDVLILMAAAAIGAQSLGERQLLRAVADRRIQFALVLGMAAPHLSQALAKSSGWQVFPLGVAAVAVFAIIAGANRSPCASTARALQATGTRESRSPDGPARGAAASRE